MRYFLKIFHLPNQMSRGRKNQKAYNNTEDGNALKKRKRKTKKKIRA